MIPLSCWRTVAFDLAQRNAVIAEKVIENLKAGKVDPMRADIESHFKYLVEDPLMEFWEGYKSRSDQGHQSARVILEGLAMKFPVIVLDALDECGSDSSQSGQRRIFMDTLTKWSRLHPCFKLLVTSRDHGITPAFRAVCHHVVLETGDLVTDESTHDIQSFFEQRFARNRIPLVRRCAPSWPGMSVIKRLTDRAAGLFIWADTVVRFLDQGPPKEQLDLILDGTFRDEEDGIDELYRQILHLSFKNCKTRVLAIFKGVVGAIALAKTPLRRTDLKHFLRRPEDESAIDFTLGKLSSVITISQSSGRIYIGHLSFAEFICDPERCDGIFVIDHRFQSQIMALSCFRVMNAGLRFNICDIETSYLRNDDLNLAPRIEKSIPDYLSYSCLFGAEHIQSSDFDTELLQEVSTFLDTRLLFWLEVLSLIKEIKTASRALLLIGEWSKVSRSILIFGRNTGRQTILDAQRKHSSIYCGCAQIHSGLRKHHHSECRSHLSFGIAIRPNVLQDIATFFATVSANAL